MGWVDPDLSRIIKKLNAIRNDLSHNLDFVISNEEVVAFKNVFPSKFKEIMAPPPGRPKKSSKSPPVYDYLHVLIILLDLNRQSVLREQYLQRKGAIELRKAMQNARRVLNRHRLGSVAD